MTERSRAASCLLLAIVVGSGGGCWTFRYLSGPKWSPRGEPLDTAVIAADHRGRDELRFVVLGDSGTGGEQQQRVADRMLRECTARGGCDLALMTGDNIYPAGVRALSAETGVEFDPGFIAKFERPYAAFGGLDFWAVPGNHDWYRRGSVDALVRYTEVSERWRMPAHDYAVPGLPDWIRIYGLDTTRIESGERGDQVRRARAALCGGEGWRLLFGHHPVYSSGPHAGANGTFRSMHEALLRPLIEACGVQLYFAGHEHHQELLRARSFDQVIQGAGGKLRGLRTRPELPPAVESVVALPRYGFAWVRVTPDLLELRFFGYDPHHVWSELLCRRYERSAFAEAALRGADCGDQGWNDDRSHGR